VRRAALVAVAGCAELPTAELGRALDLSAPPRLRELGAVFVARRGGADAAHLLARALDDTLADPAADEEGLGVVIACVRGLGRAGVADRFVLRALGAASNEPAEGVRAAAMTAIGELCPAGAAAALDRGRRDPDERVRRAAETALTTCHR
jgi:hypothetical protein